MKKDKYIECAKIINTHGCHGALKLESWCNSPEELAGLKKLYLKSNDGIVEYKVKKSSIFKQFVIVDFCEIDNMDDAMALKGKILYADRKDFNLEDGEYFIADLIGVDVIDADSGKKYGILKEIINRGASDIYVVATENGEAMIPAVSEFIVEVSIDNGILVRPIEGMF